MKKVKIYWHWLQDSLIFPITYFRLKKRISQMNETSIVAMFLELNTVNKWCGALWVTKSINSLVTKKMVTFDKEKYKLD